MPHLFDPITIRNVQLKNRLVVSPMCQYSSVDGFANDWHFVHLGSRAVGGAALVLTEAAAVTPEGRITPADLGIWKDEHLPELQRITAFVKAQGSVIGIQLAHAGRKASHHKPWEGGKTLNNEEGAWQTLAPSAIPFTMDEPAPKEMDIAGIKQLIADFVAATKRSLLAGFQVIEIHAAHGYLLNEFLSPLSNHRTDDYGGSFENRARLVLEITQAVRKTIGEEMPLFVRISATDWVEGGFTGEDAVRLSTMLKDNGADLIDCSTGGNSPEQQIPVAPLYQVEFAESIKKETGILTGAVGLITNATQASQIIEEGKADLVILARQMLRDPYFPLHAAKELGIDQTWPVQYDRAKRY